MSVFRFKRMAAFTGALTLLMAGCGGDGTARSGGGPTAGPGCGMADLGSATKPVKITMWHYFVAGANGEPSPEFAGMVDRFNRSQSQVRVELKGFGSPAAVVRRFHAIRPGGRGAPDLVQLPAPSIRVAADTGRVVPVQPCLDAAGTDLADFVPSTLAATRSAGVQWGLPDGQFSNLLLYDAGAFTRAGLDADDPPDTLAELRTAAERLKAAGVPRPIARIDSFNLLETSGVQMADADNGHAGEPRRAAFGSHDARQIVEAMQRLVDDGLVTPDPGQDWTADLRAVAGGESAMTMHSALDLKDIGQALAQGQAPGFRLGVAPLPTLHGPAGSGYYGGSFLLSNGPSLARRAAAWTFLDWFLAPAQQASWHTQSYFFPSRRSATADPAVTDLWSRQPLLAAGWKALSSGSSTTQPFVGPQARIGQELARALDDVYAHRASPAEALARAVEASDHHLADYAKDPESHIRWLTQPGGPA